MKVIGIICSPRREGNTDILVSEAIRGSEEVGAETDILTLSDYKIEPCDSCRTCKERGRCHIDDDMQGIYTKLLKADGVIIGSPVHFWTVSGQAKLFIDRSYALLYPQRRLKDKVGGAIAVATTDGCRDTLNVLNTFFLYHKFFLAGDGVSGHGGEKGEVKMDKAALEGARELGRNVVKIIKKGFSLPE